MINPFLREGVMLQATGQHLPFPCTAFQYNIASFLTRGLSIVS